MLAHRLTTILLEMTLHEAIDTTRIHRVAGRTGDRTALVTTHPFHAPHQTISDVGLIGGGHVPMPGDVSLAHNGVLFLDELPEFRRHVLEGLRQPLEEGVIYIQSPARPGTQHFCRHSQTGDGREGFGQGLITRHHNDWGDDPAMVPSADGSPASAPPLERACAEITPAFASMWSVSPQGHAHGYFHSTTPRDGDSAAAPPPSSSTPAPGDRWGFSLDTTPHLKY
jgi:hypothetical protein